ncbi:MAG: tRNA uridine-5-carboxymethylaminomethyl(34) synthesis GTPase MnmE [Paludibacteraceae bacterium]|nr:tRNA uridine-5-carboxymethylaminomethyl(34) synthesis GTPase MnmE [Paludibacteraceae bacterium]
MDTISAISTPYGIGGIAVIRVSGPEAISIVERLTCPLHSAKGYTVHYTSLHRGDEVLDDVLVSVFRAPHSFTGEDVVEIACHGSLFIQQETLRWLTDAGCRLAKAGEFTQRAFLNGKMDLSQAEAVADLIAAETKAEKDLALSHLRGGISTELASLRDQLLHFTSLIELELDFADHEELEFADRSELKILADAIFNHLMALTESFQTGNAIKNGIAVAIAGPTNAGKSTLLNALLGEDRAIVSDIAGTTRDTIEDRFVLDGILFRLIDTAGLRETDDTIESLGIERSRQAIDKAQIVIYVEDITSHREASETLARGKTVIRVLNKSDLVEQPMADEAIVISAKNNDIEPLKVRLIEIARAQMNHNGTVISNARHYEALVRAKESIVRVQKGLDEQVSGEFLSMDLQDCLTAFGEITGQITSQEVLNNIFSKFCIGK